MNKTFKIVFNKARGALMVANEVTSSVQKKGVKTVVAIAAAAACGAVAAASYSEPITASGTYGSDGEEFSITTNSDAIIPNADANITLKGKTITIKSQDDGCAGVWAEGATVTIGTADTESIMVEGKLGIVALKGHVEIAGKKLEVISSSAYSLLIQNNTQEEKAPDGASSITISADETTIKNSYTDGEGLSAYSNGQLTINSNLSVTATKAIDVRGYSTTNINTDGKHTTKLNGDIVFETPNTKSDSSGSGNLINANVNITPASK